MHRVLTAVALVLLASSAHAIVITGTDIKNGATPGAAFAPAGGTFELKTQGCTIGPGCPYTGVGVSGLTAGEIDIGETISATFTIPTTLDFFQLMVLYDGQAEFGDYEERAKVTAFLSGGGSVTAELQTNFGAGGTTATWTGGSVTNISPALASEAGVWKVTNPFGTALLSGLEFTAVAGPCGNTHGGTFACTNQSDYAIESLGYTPVPEPGTLLLLGSGLVGMAMRRRRSQG